MTAWERFDTKVLVQLTTATIGFSMALSVVTTYLPLILKRYTSSNTLIGLAIGGEGLFALGIPLVVGAVSDRIWTRWGRRRPFMILSTPFMAASLILAPLQGGFARIALITFVFFVAYHFYTAPYQSLIPDTVPFDKQGQAQGMQNLMRGVGMFFGIMVAGVLFHWWEPLPFFMTALVVLGVTYLTVATIQEQRPERIRESQPGGMIEEILHIWRTTRHEKGIHRLLVANFLWESTIAGFRPFAMLYFLYVLGVDTRTGALLIGIVGVMYVLAGLASGYMADEYGYRRVMNVGLWIYFSGCVMGLFIHSLKPALILLPLFGLGGSIVLTLPYAILMKMMPRDRVGQFTGLFVMTRGLATITAPVVTGSVIDLVAVYSPDSRGYIAIWPLAGVAVLISIFLFRRIRTRDEEESISTGV